MSGGGGAPAQPSTTTQIQDIPAWEQGYVTDLLGQAQAIAKTPYQQFPGQQVAGFTNDQNQAFSNIENAGNVNQDYQNAAFGQANQGANSADSIYGAGAGDINASTAYNPLQAITPYLGAAAGYNSAAAAQPWLNQAAGYQGAAAQAGTPQGIQSYMSPYTNSVVQGLQNEANQNWTQNIMPGVNDKFVGSGQYGSGRNAQVLGQAAGNFQTGLSANVANALESGYNTAGTQAANQAQLLAGLGGQSLTGANTASSAQGAQVSNLLNQAQAAGTATQQAGSNLLNAGTSLGNLAATQTGQQLNSANTLGNLGAQAANTNLTQNQALQATGQQQQQLNQTNLNTAQQNWQNQVNWPAQQTEYLNQIIRGLPAPTATTGSTQTTPAYSVSPLSGIGGAGTGALSLLGSNGSVLGTAQPGAKKGGLIKSYAEGGVVDDEDTDEALNPLDYQDYANDPMVEDETQSAYSAENDTPEALDAAKQIASSGAPNPLTTQTNVTPVASNSVARTNPLAPIEQAPQSNQGNLQQLQLLAMAKGMLTPTLGGNPWASLGNAFGDTLDVTQKQQLINKQLAQAQAERAIQNKRLDIEQQRADQMDQYHKDIIDTRKNGSAGVTEQLIDDYIDAHPGTSRSDAYSAVKSMGNNPKQEIAKENLALRAYNARGGDEAKQSLDYFRHKYGVSAVKDISSAVLAAPPPLSERIAGKTYNTPKGPHVWDGKQWQVSQDDSSENE